MSSSLGPPVGGPTNRERTGDRDLTLSSALRRVPDVRHIDVDAVQYCAATRNIEAVIEASSDPRKSSDLARRIAKKLGAYTVLIIHRYQDNEHRHPVIVSAWAPDGLKIVSREEMSWSDFLSFMRALHDMHRDYLADLETQNAA